MYNIPVYKLKLVKSSSRSVKVEVVKTPQEASQVFSAYLQGEDREHFVAVMLDSKNRVIGIHTISIGSLNESLVHPREVFKAAILANAAAIIVGHNHPSGDPTPSVQDVEVTRELSQAGKYLKIPVLDHVIIEHENRYVSLVEQGLMEVNAPNNASRLSYEHDQDTSE